MQRLAPLCGYRVLDLSRVLAGPFCAMLLGDLGADVVKVERPGSGDDTRAWGPPFLGPQSVYFLAVNRNKRSVSVDFSKKQGAEIVRQLATQSDVLIENFVPGRLKRYGLDYESLKKVNPDLVYCSITGYGQTGPWRERAGYDVVAAGVGGLLHITGPEGGPPCRVGVAVTDLATGLYAKGSILSALVPPSPRLKQAENNQPKGCHIDCSLLGTQVAMISHIAANYLTSEKESGRMGTGHASIVPYQAFRTRDEHYLIVGAGSDSQFVRLCELMNCPEVASDLRYRKNSSRVANRTTLIPDLEKLFRQRDLADWLKLLETSGLPHGPVNSVKEVFENPQVQYLSSRLVQEWSHPALPGPIRVPGPAVAFSSHEPVCALPPPLLGEHSRQVLKELLQYSEEDLDNLIANQVVHQDNIKQ